jgi:DNA-binding SARP family transcriptional activator
MPTRIYVTGRVYIETAGRVIEEQEFPGRQGRLLFVYLVCHRNRPMTREELADVLWHESLPRAWDAALSALVSKLRALLKDVGPDAINLESAFGSYLLRTRGDIWVDREAAAMALDESEALLRAGEWQRAFPVCHIASITARQPFLPGEDAEWIERERAALRRILVRSLDAVSEVWLANGEPLLSIENAAEAVELEPFREIGYQRLMRLHQRVGNRAEALRVYEKCRTLLADELGADPSPETQALYLDLLGTP